MVTPSITYLAGEGGGCAHPGKTWSFRVCCEGTLGGERGRGRRQKLVLELSLSVLQIMYMKAMTVILLVKRESMSGGRIRGKGVTKW